MRRLPEGAVWYALAILVVIGVPAASGLLLGTPELALPSEWADARARIDDGTLPAGWVINLYSIVLALAWIGGVWFLVMRVRKQVESTSDETADTSDTAVQTDDDREPGAEHGDEADDGPGTARAHPYSTSRSATSTRGSSCLPTR